LTEFPILINITLTITAAFIGGFLARLVKLPTLVGYLLAGVLIGPFTPGFHGDMMTIEHLAELGVIFLLFGVGLHFSLKDLWAVRAIAIPAAILQMIIISGLGILMTHFWGWSLMAGLLLGIAVAITSTVVMLRNLMDQGLLNTSAAQIAMGWLVLEDIITVLILVLLPTFSQNAGGSIWQTAGLALLKTATFAVLMLVGGTRVIPWFLKKLAFLRSRELFIIAIVVITVGTALAAASLFGASLALGAFLAGMVVSESALSHQVEAEVLPFRETFGVLFFVSVGMMVNPLNLIQHAGEVLALVALIIVGKFLLTLVLGRIFSRPAPTMLVVAVGRSQIGEFSFILGQLGVSLALLTQEQYSLLLAGAMISIIINPFLFRALPWMETRLRALPALWSLLDRQTGIQQEPIPETLQGHVVVIGYGRVGGHIIRVLSELDIPRLVIDLDVARIAELDHLKVPTLYGDAAESEILTHARVSQARAVVITLPNETATEIVTATVRALAPQVPLIVRATTQQGVLRLLALGANEVIHPELEGGLDIVRQTLNYLGYEEKKTQAYLTAVRHDHYDVAVSNEAEQETLAAISKSPTARVWLSWISITRQSALIGQTLRQINSATPGGRVVAIEHAQKVLATPEPEYAISEDDKIGVVGDQEQIDALKQMVNEGLPDKTMAQS
jgi:CPA2 family monovalent cation:H+ antiporter-2